MKTMRYWILLCLFFCLHHVHAQYRVVDAKSGMPVSYAHIRSVGQSNGAIADFSGNFTLNAKLNDNDSFKISCIGYEDQILSLASLKAQPIVRLTPLERQLNEVVISAERVKQRNLKIGVRRKSNSRNVHAYISERNGRERVTWIPNPHATTGLLQSIFVYVIDGGYPDAHFRVHIYDCSLMETRPGKELTQANIIASGTTGNEWVEVPMADQNILIGENGCFVGIEWFDSPRSRSFQDSLQYNAAIFDHDGKLKDTVMTRVRKGDGMMMGTISQLYKYAKDIAWFRDTLTGELINRQESYNIESRFNIPDTLPDGRIFTMNENSVHIPVPCMHLEIAYPKHKLKPEYRAPKKRTFNKIEKVEQDLYKYPQANVSDLFGSLIKAFENHDDVYVFKYLCVYKDEELRLLLNELSVRGTGNLFTEAERAEIIRNLKAVQAQLSESSLKRRLPKHFELSVGDEVFYLLVDNGLWKLNPISYKMTE